MSTPTKNFTYLDGLYPRMGRDSMQPALAIELQAAPVSRFMDALWKPLYYLEIKQRMDIPHVSEALQPKLLAAPILTIFWRKKQYRPPRGQLWPLTR